MEEAKITRDEAVEQVKEMVKMRRKFHAFPTPCYTPLKKGRLLFTEFSESPLIFWEVKFTQRKSGKLSVDRKHYESVNMEEKVREKLENNIPIHPDILLSYKHLVKDEITRKFADDYGYIRLRRLMAVIERSRDEANTI